MDLTAIQKSLAELVDRARDAFAGAPNEAELNQVKAAFVGKSGELQKTMQLMRDLTPDERPQLGKLVNDARQELELLLDQRRDELRAAERAQRLERERVDATLPGRRPPAGGPHPLRLVEQEIVRIFRTMGYRVAVGPEVETDFHNFTALNFPDDHPAREMHDTLKLPDGHVLRTHTSPVQIRTMLANRPPIRVVAPGQVFRSDAVDATHSPCFHQFEGLYVDRKVSMSDLKGTLEAFVEAFFRTRASVRFRPSFFPFTEPSVEVDVQCVFCGGSGCRTCKQTGWIEILGAGMVDPNVLEAVGIDPDVWSGFAFGAGIERLAMLRYGVDDIRHFYDNDVRFLAQFS